MTQSQYLHIEKLHGNNILRVAARHNLRESASELGADSHIDATRIGLNRILRGGATSEAVAQTARDLLRKAEVSIRKKQVMGLEILFSLPSGAPIDHASYFDDAVQWTEQFFNAPIISAVVHNDEAEPHCHVLILPLVDGRMKGSDLMGGLTKLRAMHADFHAKVGQKYGLIRKPEAKRISAQVRQAAMDCAYKWLKEKIHLPGRIIDTLLAPHSKDPAPLLHALGLQMPKEKLRGTSTDIMIQPTKPERRFPRVELTFAT